MHRLVHSDRGQTLVETAIVLPVVVLILFGILDAGRIFSTWVVVTNASREGARLGAVRATEVQIRDATVAAASPVGVVAGDVAVLNAGGDSGTNVSVQVSKGVSMITPLIQTFFGATVNVTNTAVMRLE